MNPNAVIEDPYIRPRPFQTGTIRQDDSIYTATRDDCFSDGYVEPLAQDRTGDVPRFSNRLSEDGTLNQPENRAIDAPRISVGYIEPPQEVGEVRRSPRNSPRRSPRTSPRLEPRVETYQNIPRESVPHIYESLDSIQKEYATLGK